MDLKFDKMSVNTNLAQEYLQIPTILQNGYDENNKFFDGNQYRPSNKSDRPDIPLEEIQLKLKDFALKLKENKELITQLEYFKRKIPIVDTMTQIQLIVRQTNYVSSLSHGKLDSSAANRIVFNCESPLLVLGYIAKKMLQIHVRCIYLCHDSTTKGICHLFTKICRDTGLPVLSTPDTTSGNVLSFSLGAVGVISELSDTDSAVDMFLASSEHVPWRLERVLVQESVYEQFKNAMTWKCKLNRQEEGNVTDSSSDALEYNRRKFLIDAVGTTQLQSQSVMVEAYRTRKELKVLLNKYKPHCLSLWANDIAEINEISHSIPSPIIWINNFGDFRGPSKVTEALFYHGDGSGFEARVNVSLAELKESWIRLSLESRREALCSALAKCITANPSEELTKIKTDLQKLDLMTPSAFIEVGKNFVCLGIPAPSVRLYTRIADLSLAFFESVLQGNAFALTQVQEKYVQAVDILSKTGIPVINLQKCKNASNIYILHSCDSINETLITATQGLKVIWTNSGTIFAN